jgi:hypothetical protein
VRVTPAVTLDINEGLVVHLVACREESIVDVEKVARGFGRSHLPKRAPAAGGGHAQVAPGDAVPARLAVSAAPPHRLRPPLRKGLRIGLRNQANMHESGIT